MRRGTLLFAALWLAGCARAPDSFPVPEQRVPIPEPELLGAFVEMGSYAALAHIVRDVAGVAEGTGWRWTYQRPELRFHLPGTTGHKLVLDFGIVPAVFASTGPTTLSVWVNGRLLGRVRCETPGERHFERPVPAAWLAADTTVIAEVDRHLVSADGARLGYTLFRAGFVE